MSTQIIFSIGLIVLSIGNLLASLAIRKLKQRVDDLAIELFSLTTNRK